MAAGWESVRRSCRERAFGLLALGYVLYVLLGGAVFAALEQAGEVALRRELREVRAAFLDDHRCLREAPLDALLEEVVSAGQHGVSALDDRSEECNSDFTSSLFFVTAFLTTTGYGSTVPLSDQGKLFCVLFCCLGIPLNLLLLSCLTQRLLPWVTRRPLRAARARWGVPPRPRRLALAHALALAGLTGALFFLLPAGVFCGLEGDWSFLEALYFCFISLSTVGLGDYLPGHARGWATRRALELALSCYLVVGLVAVLVVLETFWELPQVRDLVRFFCGPPPGQEGPLRVLPLDEQVFTGDPWTPTAALEDRRPPENDPKQYSPAPVHPCLQ
ncbi:potassium channel, subfamily K, member 7 [Lepisosteus oculatus]|uniref:potassium channel, subfamily K, member 7 n=1 Tax=Lepisosteus oculatus TaxID=7918 RepID=UPI0035F51A5F